ncbi:MAG: hypothetical protein RIQ52_1021 [Pseudomonadota bacterium]
MILRLTPWAAALLLTACASTPPMQATAPSAHDPGQIRHWIMEGRIALRSAQDGWQANVYWEHDGPQEKLRLSGPLNQGMVSIIIQSDLLYLNEGEGKVTVAHDPDALLRDRLGYTLPLQALHHWMLGQADPRNPGTHSTLTADGQLQSLNQDGWTLQFERYEQVEGSPFHLPHKLSAEGHDLRLKWVLDAWHAVPDTTH